MTFIIHKPHLELSTKAESLKYLQKLNLPIASTIVIPVYESKDRFSIEELGTTNAYYIRLCFSKKNEKKRIGKIVLAKDVEQYLIELANIASTNDADLIIQPYFSPIYAGAVLKMDNTILIETAYGISPTLFHLGRFSYRAILVGQDLIYLETVDQGISIVWENNTTKTVKHSGWKGYNPKEVFKQIIKMIEKTNNILLEWAMVKDSLVFFDHKNINTEGCFLQMKKSPPEIPLCVTTTYNEATKASSSKRKIYFDYPDIKYLPQARNYDYVIVRQGALLSHLSVYSLHENYKCVFHK